MIELALVGKTGEPLWLEVNHLQGDEQFAGVTAGAVLMLRGRHEKTPPLPEGQRIKGVPTSAAHERLIDSIADWRNVRYNGQSIACSRSLVRLVLCLPYIRAQVEAALREHHAAGMLT